MWGKLGEFLQGKIMEIVFTDLFIKNLNNAGRYTDKQTPGLNIQIKVAPNINRYWAFRYVYAGKRYDLALGAYPNISLKEARKRAINARSELNQGKRPTTPWKPQKIQAEDSCKPKFAEFAIECINLKKSEWSNSKHVAQWFKTIEEYANPFIGNKFLDEIETEDILKILTPIWHSKTETASRIRGRVEWILSAAKTKKLRTGFNPASWKGHLETILPKPAKITKVVHHPALPYKDLTKFISQLQEMSGVPPLALEFLILNANRTGEVLGGLKAEIVDGLWIIPEFRMKADKEHRVPLGKRSLELLQIASSLDPNSKYLFSIRGRPLSNMAMPMALRRMGLNITVHGFRSTFRDWVAEETLHSPEVAEKALAHTIKNQVEAAYRRGDLLEHRKHLMKDWESYCLTGSWGNLTILHNQQKIA
jgi:integrase